MRLFVYGNVVSKLYYGNVNLKRKNNLEHETLDFVGLQVGNRMLLKLISLKFRGLVVWGFLGVRA